MLVGYGDIARGGKISGAPDGCGHNARAERWSGAVGGPRHLHGHRTQLLQRARLRLLAACDRVCQCTVAGSGDGKQNSLAILPHAVRVASSAAQLKADIETVNARNAAFLLQPIYSKKTAVGSPLAENSVYLRTRTE